MSYQVKRIDPYWMNHPMIPVLVVAGVVVALVGMRMSNVWILGIGGALAAAAVFAATRLVISVVLGTLGVLGGVATFIVFPKPEAAGMSMIQQLLAAVFFAGLYMILMDALILAVAVLYNFFSAALGMGGISIDIEEGGPEEGA